MLHHLENRNLHFLKCKSRQNLEMDHIFDQPWRQEMFVISGMEDSTAATDRMFF